ncbi:hypothetical protein [Enterococcus sp. DIV2324]|uniref:hypothetical protein n=1 Tax=Enterococcus sp. DIV2324 TaxID=2774763 RepID=UPI003F28F3D0
MYILFTDDPTGSLPINSKIPLSSVNEILRQLNQNLLDADQEVRISYDLLSSEGKCVYRSTAVLPDPRFSLYQTIVNEFGTDLNPDSEVFLNMLKVEFEGSKTGKKKKRSPSKLFKRNSEFSKTFLPLLFILTAMFLFMTTSINGVIDKVEKINRDAETSTTKDIPTSQIDAFSRYFLSNYFNEVKSAKSYQETLKTYVSNDQLKKFEGNEQQLKSSLLWDIKQDKKEYVVSYIVSLREDEQTQTQKITFTLAADKDETYKVKAVPKLEEFTMKLNFQEE